jgi:hypothetical protein
MNVFHKGLAEGRWFDFTLCAQMANIGSEVERAMSWGRKGNQAYKQISFYRALELIDLTLRDPKHQGRRREIARVREALADFIQFGNEYKSTEEQWRRYFHAFTYAARMGK